MSKSGRYIFSKEENKVIKISDSIPHIPTGVYGFQPDVYEEFGDEKKYIGSRAQLRSEMKKEGLRLKEPGEKDQRVKRRKERQQKIRKRVEEVMRNV